VATAGEQERRGILNLWLAKTSSAALLDEEYPAYRTRALAIAERRSHPAAMLLVLKLLFWGFRSLALSRQALVLDNLALRQQLATFTHGGRRPRLVPANRAFWVALRARWSDWTVSLAIV
jgi:hypothetical protein